MSTSLMWLNNSDLSVKFKRIVFLKYYLISCILTDFGALPSKDKTVSSLGNRQIKKKKKRLSFSSNSPNRTFKMR